MFGSIFQWILNLLSRLRKSDTSEPSSPSYPSQQSSSGNEGSSSQSRVITVAWGQKVSQTFRDRIAWTADALGVPVDYLMAVIAFETGETFSPSVRNAAGSGATGLIQFMPATARNLGTTTEALAYMTAEDQINYVYKYLKPYKGRLNTLSDVYMAVLWPAAVGKPEDYVLWDRTSRPTTYRQNAGLDINKDGIITKQEATERVKALSERGRMFAWTGTVHPT